MKWQDISTAPRDGTRILGLCVHDADPYFLPNNRITTYASHCESGPGQADDGVHIVQWGGEYTEYEDEYTNTPSCHIPDWWFLAETDFGTVANPTHWMPLPESPKT